MNVIKKLLKRENILVLSLIFVALLGVVGVPQTLGLIFQSNFALARWRVSARYTY